MPKGNQTKSVEFLLFFVCIYFLSRDFLHFQPTTRNDDPPTNQLKIVIYCEKCICYLQYGGIWIDFIVPWLSLWLLNWKIKGISLLNFPKGKFLKRLNLVGCVAELVICCMMRIACVIKWNFAQYEDERRLKILLF